MSVTPLCMADIINPVTFGTKVPYPEQSTDDENTRWTQTLAMSCELYLPEAWNYIYTDVSTVNAIQDGRLGIVIYSPSGSTVTLSTATYRHCSNHKAESEALVKVFSADKDSNQKRSIAVFLTNALSVLQALTKTIVTSSKSKGSATTQKQLHTGPPDTRPLRSSWKWTGRQPRKERCTYKTTKR